MPSDLRGFAWDHEKGTEDKEELRQIEWEMKRGAQDSFAGLMRVDLNAHGELMDFIYRTTVLEPINRFCAYFPDINECKWILCCEDVRVSKADKVHRYQEAEPQDARLRLNALESQATHREAR